MDKIIADILGPLKNKLPCSCASSGDEGNCPHCVTYANACLDLRQLLGQSGDELDPFREEIKAQKKRENCIADGIEGACERFRAGVYDDGATMLGQLVLELRREQTENKALAQSEARVNARYIADKKEMDNIRHAADFMREDLMADHKEERATEITELETLVENAIPSADTHYPMGIISADELQRIIDKRKEVDDE